MTDKELFNNMCPYTDEECQNDWDCHNCKVEEDERQFMKDLQKEYERELKGENK